MSVRIYTINPDGNEEQLVFRDISEANLEIEVDILKRNGYQVGMYFILPTTVKP